MKKIKIFFLVLAVLLLAFIIILSARNSENNSQDIKDTDSVQVVKNYDAFATCLKDKGAVFYGAFWCSHCKNNKEMFGTSQSLIPYVECSSPDGQGQLQVCIDKKITGYPTWEFADGSRLMGEVQLATLAEKTACPLP